MLENFKSPLFVKFDGYNNPQEHIISINTQMIIIGVFDCLKSKLLSATFRGRGVKVVHGSTTNLNHQLSKASNKIGSSVCGEQAQKDVYYQPVQHS